MLLLGVHEWQSDEWYWIGVIMKIGLALGSGSSRGWAHIGIINTLSAHNIVPDIICGTSIGSLVGAAYVTDHLDKLEEWVRTLTKFKTARFLDINTSLNGFVNKKRFHHFLNEYVASDNDVIEKFDKKYAAVATDLATGREIWLTNGSILEAVWSSISLPGLFPAIRNNNKWLVDGGLVNPVPVSVCRALGADIVIAVSLHDGVIRKYFQKNNSDNNKTESPKKPDNNLKANGGIVGKFTDLVTEYTASVFSSANNENKPPSLFEAIVGAVNIAQDRITRSRMAGDPPDILLSPKLAHIGPMEFYRANDAISEGKKCVERMLPEIEHLFDRV